MRRTFLAVLLFAVLAYTGCGHDHGQPVIIPTETQILSDSAFDGDIEQNPPGTFTITQGNAQSLFAGVDPSTLAEFRAFLDFPLTDIPLNASIYTADLDLVIDSVRLQGDRVPIRIDLVAFDPPTLISSDYDRNAQPPLASLSFDVFTADVGRHLVIDVTSLMREAQRLGLNNFQVRILEDLGAASPGIIEIDDTTGADRADVAPFLTVQHFP